MKPSLAVLGRESGKGSGAMYEGVVRRLKPGSSDLFSLFGSPNPSSEPSGAHCYISFTFLSVFLNAFYLSELTYPSEWFKNKIILQSPTGISLPGLLS